jgi:erythronate-4-phosphate dehydrogenase
MKVIIDSAIPYIKGVLEPYAEVLYRDGREFSPHEVSDADVLVIRTRTRCDEALLARSRVKMIATATIGFDHIDLTYCATHGIRVVTAAGCNAAGVLQWVSASLALIQSQEGWQPNERTLGIVGVGNVGSLVERYGKMWGFNVLRCDPPRKEREGGDFLSLEEVAERSDIITFHTPLDSSTFHMIDEKLLSLLPHHSTIINASRGEVASTQALLAAPQRLCIDVWEGEPNINLALLEKAFVATPHIAGYSAQGKANATALAVQALARHFDLPLKEWRPSEVEVVEPKQISWVQMCATIGQYCDLATESEALRNDPELFESLRNNYRYREEYF